MEILCFVCEKNIQMTYCFHKFYGCKGKIVGWRRNDDKGDFEDYFFNFSVSGFCDLSSGKIGIRNDRFMKGV